MNLDKKIIAIMAQDGSLFGRSLKSIDSDFFDGPYSKIHQLLKSYYIKHKSLPSIDTLEEQLHKHKTKIFGSNPKAEDVILSFRTETALVDPKDFEFLIEELKTRKSYSIVEKALPDAVSAAKQGEMEKFTDMMQQAIVSIKKNSSDSLVAHSSNQDYVDEFLDKYTQTEENPTQAWGLKLGFHKLDQATFGMKSGEMLIIAARHGNGKSIWLLSAAINIFKQGYNVAYVSLEMPTEQMWERITACYTGFPINAIKEARLTPEQKEIFFKSLAEFKASKNRFEVIDAPHITVPTIASELDILIEKHKPDVLIVDYLGIVKPTVNGLQDNLAQASVVEELRQLARTRKIPILSAVQLNREPGKGKGKTKGTERLSRSDVIGATVDIALQIEEVDTDEAITKLTDKTKIYVTKNRKGPMPVIEVRKNFACARFEDWEPALGWGIDNKVIDIQKKSGDSAQRQDNEIQQIPHNENGSDKPS